jgi:23S rRNA (cytidine1920-2'-O)/16S rRNA (cytidine1409-2'-O)-methyltransferase
MTKKRLDALLFERGVFESREKARQAIMAGRIKISNRIADKPGAATDDRASIFVEPAQVYVSRGADKLNRALDVFGLEVAGRIALDAGASTGGFTEVLLERGATRVMAVDVGYGQLAWKLRQDPRVDVLERTNIRHLKTEVLPAKAGVVTADLSFISLATVAEALAGLSEVDADFVFLIKPQFEAGKGKVGKGGIIREASRHEEILENVISRLDNRGLSLRGLTYSPITGADGNIEFLGWFRKREVASSSEALLAMTETHDSMVGSSDIVGLIHKVVEEAHEALGKQ